MTTRPASNRTPAGEKRRQLAYTETMLDKEYGRHEGKVRELKEKIARLSAEAEALEAREEEEE